jgi:hypothetical protein
MTTSAVASATAMRLFPLGDLLLAGIGEHLEAFGHDLLRFAIAVRAKEPADIIKWLLEVFLFDPGVLPDLHRTTTARAGITDPVDNALRLLRLGPMFAPAVPLLPLLGGLDDFDDFAGLRINAPDIARWPEGLAYKSALPIFSGIVLRRADVLIRRAIGAACDALGPLRCALTVPMCHCPPPPSLKFPKSECPRGEPSTSEILFLLRVFLSILPLYVGYLLPNFGGPGCPQVFGSAQRGLMLSPRAVAHAACLPTVPHSLAASPLSYPRNAVTVRE